MKTLLLNPPSGFNGKFVSREQCGIGLVDERFLPSEIFLAAAFLQEAGLDVDIIDMHGVDLDFSPYQIAVVWVSVLHTFHKDIDWLRRAKDSGCRTVMILNEPYGEFEADVLRRYKFIDAAARLWERELSLEALLKSWENDLRPEYPGLIFRDNDDIRDMGLHNPREDLSHLPSCTKLLQQQPLHTYEAVGITPGRGCTAGCRFCLYANMAQRKRPLDFVISELEAVAGHVKKIFLLDPDLPSTRQWTETFCRRVIERKMPIRWRADLRPKDADPKLLQLFRKSGCEQVMIAVETLDEQILEKIGEGHTPEKLHTAINRIRQTGIRPMVYFYIGLPWDSPQSLAKIKQFLAADPIANFFLKQVRPWPGTSVHEAFRSSGLLGKKLMPEDFVDSDSPLCPTLHLSNEALIEWKNQIWRAAILQPRYVWRFLKERRLRCKHISQLFSLLLGRNIFAGK